VITVAMDKSADDARPWIEAANPTHPSLIDTEHFVADLYNMVNVPEILWIDEDGRIVRPNDVAFGNDTWRAVTGFEAAKHANLLRAWVKGEAPARPPDAVRDLQHLPTAADQLARAEFGLGNWLYHDGRVEAARSHFVRAGQLAPHDFMIRRGTMPMQGLDSGGPEFFKMVQDWQAQGNSYYRPLPDTAPDSVPRW
jgi:hypothetical protein